MPLQLHTGRIVQFLSRFVFVGYAVIGSLLLRPLEFASGLQSVFTARQCAEELDRQKGSYMQLGSWWDWLLTTYFI
jgi:hypothetical protein